MALIKYYIGMGTNKIKFISLAAFKFFCRGKPEMPHTKQQPPSIIGVKDGGVYRVFIFCSDCLNLSLLFLDEKKPDPAACAVAMHPVPP